MQKTTPSLTKIHKNKQNIHIQPSAICLFPQFITVGATPILSIPLLEFYTFHHFSVLTGYNLSAIHLHKQTSDLPQGKMA
jgi:hypothetical protein